MEEEEKRIWEPLPGETSKQYAAFEAFRALLPTDRTIGNAFRAAHGLPKGALVDSRTRGWEGWCRDNRWIERAAAWDRHLTRERESRQKAMVDEILSHRYANMYVRVQELDAVAHKLREQIDDDERLWVREEKQVGYGKEAYVVQTRRFNNQLVEQFRACLSDIASELGERVRKSDVTSNGESVKAYISIDVDKV